MIPIHPSRFALVGILFCIVGRTMAADIATGLVGHWTFDEAAGGVVRDYSGNDNHGTWSSVPEYRQTDRGWTMEVSGSPTVSVPNATSVNFSGGDVTIAAWVNPTSSHANMTILDKSGNYRFLTDDQGGGFLEVTKVDANGQTLIRQVAIPSGSIPTGQWTHLAGTYDGHTMRVYLNGVQTNGYTIGDDFVASGAPLLLGSFHAGSPQTGLLLDDIRFYNRTLLSEDLNQIISEASRIQIDSQPRGFLGLVGSSATIAVSGTTNETVSFQWYHDGTPLPGRTAMALALNSLALSDAGSYHVIATGPINSVTSTVAIATILLPEEDNDSDGFSNRQEIENLGTDPFKDDTDGDGLPDAWEVLHGFSAAGGDSGAWHFVREIGITNTSPAGVSNAEVRLQLDLSIPILDGKMQPGLEDIRFATSSNLMANGPTVPHWVETAAGANSIVWVNVPLLPAGYTNFFMFYGHANATNASDAGQVFAIYDDFSTGPLNTNTWSGTGSIGGGELALGTGQSVKSIREFDQAAGWRLDYRLRKRGVGETDGSTIGFADSVSDGDGAHFWWVNAYSHDNNSLRRRVTTVSDKGNVEDFTPVTIVDEWHLFRQIYTAATNRLVIDGGQYQTDLSGNASGAENVFFGVVNNAVTTSLQIDYVQLRKWIDPVPGFTLGSEFYNTADALADADQDGLNNLVEFVSSTDPRKPDTDGDTLPDGWELQYNLDPNDLATATEIPVGDRLTYLQKFVRGLDPSKPDSDGDGVSDFDEIFHRGADPLNPPSDLLKREDRMYYDANNRLVGIDYANGYGIGFVYDENGNRRRRIEFNHLKNTNGLPTLWRFQHGMSTTNFSGVNDVFGDADGDGWSNFQEWEADSHPLQRSVVPDVLGPPQLLVQTVQWNGEVTNVQATAGAIGIAFGDVVVVGASGYGITNNQIHVLFQGSSGWNNLPIDIGSSNVLSLAVGEIANREGGAVYSALVDPNGNTSLLEYQLLSNVWVGSVLYSSTNRTMNVIGLDEAGSLWFDADTVVGQTGQIHRAYFTNESWYTELVSTNRASISAAAILASSDSEHSPTLATVVDGDRIVLRRFTDSADYEEFFDGMLSSSAWSTNLTADPTASATIAEQNDELAVAVSWAKNPSSATASATLSDIWADGNRAMEIQIRSAWHSSSHSRKNGSADVQFGSTTIYAVPGFATDNSIVIQIVRLGDQCFYRKRIGTGSMSPWTAVSLADSVRFYSTGEPGTSNQTGSSGLYVSSIKKFSVAAMSGQVGSGDFSAGTVRYVEAEGRWFEAGPNPESLSSARQRALGAGGSLLTITDTSRRDWITANFSGNLWLAYYRRTADSPWQWDAPQASGQTFWANDQPVEGDDLLYGFVDIPGFWAATNRVSQLTTVIEYDQSRFVRQTVIPLTNTPIAHQSRFAFVQDGGSTGAEATSLLVGDFDDKDGNSEVNEGDQLILMDFVISNMMVVATNVVRTPVGPLVKDSQFASAMVDIDFSVTPNLFLGEPDGTVSTWNRNVEGVLERRVFSRSYAGRKWTHLLPLEMIDVGNGLVGISPVPSSINCFDIVHWPPTAEKWSEARISQSAPYITVLTNNPVAGASVPIRVFTWDLEGNQATPAVEYRLHEEGVWGTASIATAILNSPPTGAEHLLVWNAGVDLGTGVTNTVQLRARATDVTLTGPYSLPANYEVSISAGAPVAANDIFRVSEDVATNLAILANDQVRSGFMLQVDSVTQGEHGAISINADKTVRYQPQTNYHGMDTFIYTISDGAGSSSQGNVTVNIIPVNDPPVAPDYSFNNQTEDQQLSFRWNGDRDAEGDYVRLKSADATSANGGGITVSGDTITYTPPPNRVGGDSFMFVVEDDGKTDGTNDFKTATGTVTVNLLGVNDAPVIYAPADLAGIEDAPLVVTNLTVDDVDAGVLRFGISVTNGILQLGRTNGLNILNGVDGSGRIEFSGSIADLNSGLSNLVYWPSTNFFGLDHLALQLHDDGQSGAGGPMSAVPRYVPLTIAGVNDPPMISIATPTNAAVFLTLDHVLLAADIVPGDSAVDRVEFFADGIEVGHSAAAPFEVTWTNPPARSSIQLTAKAFDVLGSNSVSAPVGITVRVPGLILLPTIQPQSIVENSTLNITNTATDPENLGHALEYTLVRKPAGASISSAGVITWTPTEVQGPTNVVFETRAVDTLVTNRAVQNSFTVSVAEQNLPPLPRLIPNTNAVENAVFAYDASTTDPDIPTNNLLYSLRQQPAGMTINPASGLIQWTPGENAGGTSETVVVEVRDDGNPPATNSYSFNITVQEDQQAPSLVAIPLQSIVELEPWTVLLSAMDPDRPTNTLSFAKLAGPSAMNLDTNTGLFSWTPGEADGSNEFRVTVAVYDAPGGGLSATQEFVVVVHETNSPPQLVSATNITVMEMTPLVFSNVAVDSDMPANGISFSLSNGLPGVTLGTNDGILRWMPEESHGAGVYQFTVIATDDGAGRLSASQVLQIEVLESNRPPTMAAVGDQTVNEHELLSLQLVAADPDIPTNQLTFTKVTGPPGLTVNPTNGLLRWTPGETEDGGHTVVVRVGDGFEPPAKADQAFVVAVNEINSPPVLDAVPSQMVRETSTLTFQLTARDSDQPTNSLTFEKLSGPTGVSISTAGIFSWAPTSAQGPSNYVVSVRVTDNGMPRLSDDLTFSVAVSEDNTSPVLAPIADTNVAEGLRLSMAVSATDSDDLYNQLSFALVSSPTNMTIDDAGLIAWVTGEQDGPSTNTVTVQVKDNATPPAMAQRSFVVVVDEVNLPPSVSLATNATVVEESLLVLIPIATDSDWPTNRLTFHLGPGSPTNASLDTATGRIDWTPSEVQGPDSYAVMLVGTDDGEPELSVTNVVQVAVLESNSPPVLVPLNQLTIDELVTSVVTNVALDPDMPTNALVFSLGLAAPTNATIDPSTGVLTWTPTESQGSNAAVSFAVIVRDNGEPAGSATNTLTIFVNELNSAPAMVGISNRVHRANRLLSIPTSASDADLPSNRLAFEVLSSQVGLMINTTNGLLTWTPTTNQIGTNTIALRVYDNGVPSLAATQTFEVIVSGGLAPTLSIRIERGTPVLGLNAEPGVTYQINITTNLNGSNWTVFPTTISGQSGHVEIRDTNAVGSKIRYYRAIVE